MLIGTPTSTDSRPWPFEDWLLPYHGVGAGGS
jgi:hypothetical protein